ALGGGNNQIFFSAIPTIAGNTSVSGGVSREGILPYATVNNADFASTLNTDSRTITPFDRYYTGTFGGASSNDTVKVTTSPGAFSAILLNAILISGDNITIGGSTQVTITSGALFTTGATSTGDTLSAPLTF